MQAEAESLMLNVPEPPRYWQTDSSPDFFGSVWQDFAKLMVQVDDQSLAYDKLAEKSKQDRIKLLLGVIEIVDALERVSINVEKRKAEAPEVLQPLGSNLRTILLMIGRFLEQQGVLLIDPADNLATPGDHHILETRVDGSVPEYYILETIEKGYRLEDEILRKAQVVTAVPR